MEEKYIETLEKYISDYNEKVTADNAQKCMENFDENWKTITAYFADDTPKRQSKYGLALVIFSVANYESSNISEKYIAHLSELIDQYDTDDNVKYQFGVKQSLFFNLGLCWHKLGTRYDENAVLAFKKYLFHLLAQSNSNSFANLSLFSFRKCNEYLYKSLINEQLNLSSPSEFNDPFDCNCYYADGNTMMDVFRVFCFTHAYDNILMWSYYANSHEGYALQYSYSSLLDRIQGVALDGLCVYGEVEYIDQRPKTRSHSNRFSFSNLNFYIQATFAKFKEWSHEREYRFVFILDNQEEEATNREAEEKLSDWVVLPKVDILQGYAGCQAKKIMKDSPYPIRQLKKDIINYQLKG